ncbi:hypothetical protein RJ640_025674 [Escallonia rubra]|uniref:Dof-type domain-containing protein n=1 Tax=Escallonia rubra TaxID=112253 RepID=A0AA88UQQ7_9ASTE|nr:hypothetical protein RJ640_025674 [Escallonia rubra]
MPEFKDPAIKLFGKTIQLPEISAPAADSRGVPPPPPPPREDASTFDEDLPSSPEDSSLDGVIMEEQQADKDPLGEKVTDAKAEGRDHRLTSEEFPDQNADMTSKEPRTASADNEAAAVKCSKTEEEQSDTSDPQEKTLKKPDKILPCPRCNSMDTKFCYYNNYNVNQPRHFCKKCQRYWTAGGTMRNVPVGAGRRKNKNSVSHYRHITVAEALHNARADLPNGFHHPTLKANGTVLNFGSDNPLCDSMASVLKIAEKTMRNSSQNGFHKPEELRRAVSYGSVENGDDNSCGSSVTATNSKEVGKGGLQDPVVQNSHSFPQQIPCFPGAPWPYPWNPAQWNSQVPPPAFCPASYPMPFYPASPYWGCTVPGSWNVQWVAQLPPPNHAANSYGPNSSTLGKHAREENVDKSTNSGEREEEPQKENNPERCLWFPKTLRIDDPGEAARSPIWATLGIRNDKADSVSGGGLFKAFQTKGNEKSHTSQTSRVLQANPAALSRSLNFHESL